MESSINLYDLNKINMAQLKPYSKNVLYNKCMEIAGNIWDANWPSVFAKKDTDKKYWMFLCREKNNYTIFCLQKNVSKFRDALYDCCRNRGQVLDITQQPDGNYEIWIKDGEDISVYYLFDYDLGVIEV